MPDNVLRWDGTDGHYEVYFLKFNDLETKTAAWIRYTILAPCKGEPIAELWGFFFDQRHPDKNFAMKNTFHRDYVKSHASPFALHIGTAVLKDTSAKGAIISGKRKLTWDISWESDLPTVRLFPYRWMYRTSFPRSKVLSPNPDILVSGKLETEERTYSFKAAPGQQSHLWGTGYVHSWSWLHCNSFREEKAVFEGLSAQVDAGPFRIPVTVFALHFRNRLYRLNSPLSMLRNRSESKLGLWKFQGAGAGMQITGNVRAKTQFTVGACYTSPSGENRWCHNSKIGDIDLQIIRQNREVATLSAHGSCAVEWASTSKDPRVKIWA